MFSSSVPEESNLTPQNQKHSEFLESWLVSAHSQSGKYFETC